MTNSEKCFVFVHKTLQNGSDVQCHIHREWPYGRDEVIGLSNESNEKNETNESNGKSDWTVPFVVSLQEKHSCFASDQRSSERFLLCKRPEVERKMTDDGCDSKNKKKPPAYVRIYVRRKGFLYIIRHICHLSQ